MATPEAEETVAAPPTAEAVVAEVVKTAESGEKEVLSKEAPKAEEPAKVEEPTSTEETPAEATTEATEEAAEAAPVEPSIPAFKEESNLVADLKETEKKALEDFKARIVKAIADNEFKVPKKVVEAPKEPEVVEAPKEVEAKAAETDEAAPAAETPAVEAAAVETPAAEAPPAETETPAAEEVAPSATTVETVKETAKAVVEDVKEAVKEAVPEPSTEAPAAAPVAEPVSAPEEVPAAAETVEAPAAEAVVETETKEASPVVEVETKEAAPVEEAPAVEEEPEDLTPPEDVSLWGVPLLHTKGDKRTDVILLKFLRARDFNVALAFEQLKKTIIWRKTFKADSLLEEDFGTELDGVAFNYGKDKEGHPVCYNVYGVFQNKDLYAKTFGDAAKITDFLRWRVQVLEKGIKLLNFSPEGPNSMVQITDLKNYPGQKKELKTAYNQALSLLQDNYPELVAKKVFINVPWYFSAMYSFVSPFLTARTKSKFVVAPPGKSTEALLKFIAPEYVPVNYGGLSKVNDPDFTAETPGIELLIKAGEKSAVEIPVTEVGGTVVWELAVLGYEVTYAAEYVPSAEGSYVSIIEKPKKLPSTTEEPVRTSFKITEPGKIVFSIDNATRKKKFALYRYVVKSPATAEPELAG